MHLDIAVNVCTNCSFVHVEHIQTLACHNDLTRLPLLYRGWPPLHTLAADTTALHFQVSAAFASVDGKLCDVIPTMRIRDVSAFSQRISCKS